MALVCFFFLITAISAQGLQNFYQDSPYADGNGQSDAFSSIVPDGAPVPVAPSSVQELGLSIPEEEAASYQTPPSKEASRPMIATDSAQIADAASSDQFSGEFQATKFFAGNYPANNYPTQSMIVFPQGTTSRNKLYISNVPKTVAGCSQNGWLPMWLQTFSTDPIWFYEWYPSGRLSVNYLGYASVGWQKKWFNGDTPGWHILQFYSRGWSNYIYIYVSGKSSGQWTDLGPYGRSAPMSKPSYKGTSTVSVRSSWFSGYDVYLDGTYIGTDGAGSDLLDGIYSFSVPGDMWHTIVLMKNGQSYPETGTFLSGASYRFTI